MYSLDSAVRSNVVHRAHMTFGVRRSDIDCLRRNNILTTQAAPFTRKETYWDTSAFSLLGQGFSLKSVAEAERPWILEEVSGLRAEATDRASLVSLVRAGHDLNLTPFAELLVEVSVYSVQILGGFRIELQKTSWQFFEDLVFCNRLDVITRRECQDTEGACEEIVAAMGRLGISQRALPVGLSHVDNILHGKYTR